VAKATTHKDCEPHTGNLRAVVPEDVREAFSESTSIRFDWADRSTTLFGTSSLTRANEVRTNNLF